MWGVSLTHPVLPSFLCGEFLLHIPCCVDFYAGSFSYTSHFSFFFSFFISGISHTDPLLISFSIKGVSLTHPVLAPFLSGVFLLHIPCWLQFYLGSFSYTSHAGFTIIWGVSLTHPMLALILSGEFLLHIPCWLHFYLGSFSYTSRAGFKFYLGCFSYTSRAGFILSG